MTPTTPHNPNEALEAFNRLTYYLQAEVAPDGYSSDDADRDYKAVFQALTRPTLDLAAIKHELSVLVANNFKERGEGKDTYMNLAGQLTIGCVMGHLAAIRPDLFGGK